MWRCDRPRSRPGARGAPWSRCARRHGAGRCGLGGAASTSSQVEHRVDSLLAHDLHGVLVGEDSRRRGGALRRVPPGCRPRRWPARRTCRPGPLSPRQWLQVRYSLSAPPYAPAGPASTAARISTARRRSPSYQCWQISAPPPTMQWGHPSREATRGRSDEWGYRPLAGERWRRSCAPSGLSGDVRVECHYHVGSQHPG